MSYIFWILISFCHLKAEWDCQWFCSVHLLSCVRPFATPWTAARQASLSISNSQSLLKLMSIESVIPSNHLILCCPLLLLPSIFPSTRVFSNESVLHIRWPKYWSFSFTISPFKNGSINGQEMPVWWSFPKRFRKWTQGWKPPLIYANETANYCDEKW